MLASPNVPLCGLVGLPNNMALGSKSKHPERARQVYGIVMILSQKQYGVTFTVFYQLRQYKGLPRFKGKGHQPSSTPQWEESHVILKELVEWEKLLRPLS